MTDRSDRSGATRVRRVPRPNLAPRPGHASHRAPGRAGSVRGPEHGPLRAGFTLVEVMVSVFVLTIGVYILSSTVTSAVSHAIVQEQRSIAIAAVGNTIEELHAQPFAELFALYNGATYDDPGGPGTAPGAVFPVDGLEPILDAAGNPLPVGQIILPSASGVLREDVTMAALGMPRDLDGDLVVDAVDHSRDYLVLPVIVRVSWQSRVGPRSYQMETMFAELGKL